MGSSPIVVKEMRTSAEHPAAYAPNPAPPTGSEGRYVSPNDRTRSTAGEDMSHLSYLMPPSSAVEGMFRAIAFLRDGAYICATRVQLCSPIKLLNIVTNYRGPYRKSALLSDGNS